MLWSTVAERLFSASLVAEYGTGINRLVCNYF